MLFIVLPVIFFRFFFFGSRPAGHKSQSASEVHRQAAHGNMPTWFCLVPWYERFVGESHGLSQAVQDVSFRRGQVAGGRGSFGWVTCQVADDGLAQKQRTSTSILA